MAPSIRISSTEATKLDFDVSIQGLDETKKKNADVRFVVEGASYDAVIRCTDNGSRWAVNIPPMPLTEAKKFRVEVIVDEYYFVPVSGNLQVVTPPKVMAEGFTQTEEKIKPAVSASFGTLTESIVEEPQAPKTLLEYAAIAEAEQRDLNRAIKGLSVVMKKASDILDESIAAGNISTQTVSNVMGLIEKALASVEVKIYV